MKRTCLVFALLLSAALCGCDKDDRIRRQASYVNTVTQVTANEFRNASTIEKKVIIADAYFRRMPKHTQNLEDYMLGKEPSGPSPEEVKKRREKAEAIDVPGREGIGNE
jgi:hypothetical protein